MRLAPGDCGCRYYANELIAIVYFLSSVSRGPEAPEEISPVGTDRGQRSAWPDEVVA